jgi:hypothetical protein
LFCKSNFVYNFVTPTPFTPPVGKNAANPIQNDLNGSDVQKNGQKQSSGPAVRGEAKDKSAGNHESQLDVRSETEAKSTGTKSADSKTEAKSADNKAEAKSADNKAEAKSADNKASQLKVPNGDKKDITYSAANVTSFCYFCISLRYLILVYIIIVIIIIIIILIFVSTFVHVICRFSFIIFHSFKILNDKCIL